MDKESRLSLYQTCHIDERHVYIIAMSDNDILDDTFKTSSDIVRYAEVS